MGLEELRPRTVVFVALVFLALVAVHLRWGGEQEDGAPPQEQGPLLSHAQITNGGESVEIDFASLPSQSDVEGLMARYAALLVKGEVTERRTTALELAHITHEPQDYGKLLQLSSRTLDAVRQALLEGLNDPDARVSTHCRQALVGLWRISDSAAVIRQFQQGLAAHERRQFDDALAAFSNAEKVQSNVPPDLHRMKAEIYLAKSLPAEALEECRRALEAEPRHFLALYALAKAQAETGHRDEALEALDRALAIYKAFPEANELRRKMLEPGGAAGS